MSNARKLADNLPTDGQLSGRNVLQNGQMTIAQRGTSFDTNGTSNAEIQLVDRWMAVRRATSGALTYDATITQSTDTPTGFDKSLKVDVDTAQTPTGSDNALIVQKIEGQNLQQFGWGSSDAKPITLSFWVKSNKTGTYCIQTRYTANSDSGLYEYSISSSGVWEHKTLTIPANTSLTLASTNTTGMEIMFSLAVGSSDHAAVSNSLSTTGFRATSNQVNLFDNASNYWQITGVQMEVGSQASPFEHELVGVTLAKCQRYFHKLKGPVHAHPMWTYGGTTASTNFKISPEMRTTPSVSFTGTTASNSAAGNTDDNFSAYSHNAWRGTNNNGVTYGGTSGSNSQSIRINIQPSSNFPAGYSAGLYYGSNCSINLDAEL